VFRKSPRGQFNEFQQIGGLQRVVSDVEPVDGVEEDPEQLGVVLVPELKVGDGVFNHVLLTLTDDVHVLAE